MMVLKAGGAFASAARHGLPVLALAALLSAPSPASARNCDIQSQPTGLVGAAIAFSLACDAPLTERVAWEFGDGATLAYGSFAQTSHAYAAPGNYFVFARIEGEDIPSSESITITTPVTATASTHAVTLLLDRKQNRLWNVNIDNNSVTVIATATQQRVKEIPVGRAPRTLALDAQGRIWVANQDDATLTLIDGTSLAIVKTIALPYASRPYGVCADPAGTSVYVTLEALGQVLKVDAATGTIQDSLKVFPTPRGIAVAADGKNLWVTRFNSPKDRGEVARIQAAPFALKVIIPLEYDKHQDTESNSRGVPNAISSLTVSPDGTRVWIPSKKDNVGRGTFVDPDKTLLDFQTSVRTIVSQIDAATDKEVAGARLDLDNRSMACDVIFNKNGSLAFVATETSNEIAILDAATGERITAIEPVDLARERSPNGMQLSDNDSLLFIHDFLSREVAVYDVSKVGGTNLMPKLALISTVEKEQLAPAVLRGKKVFYNAADPRMSHDKYLSCAACHLDGGTDSRVWDFTQRGEGLRRTTSLLGKAGTGQGPMHWSANFDEVQDFEQDIRNAFDGRGFMDSALYFQGTRNTSLGDAKAGFSPDLDDLAAYVTSLTHARPSPFRRPDGSLTDQAKEGEKIFNRAEVGCAVCHVPPLYTDSRIHQAANAVTAPGTFKTPQGFLLHDVGTLNAGAGQRLSDTLRGFDTPTLTGIWENASFLHDGSAASVMEVITTANPNDRHGKTSQLSALEKDQLAAFLMQINDSAGSSGIVDRGPRKASAGAFSLAAVRSADGIRFTLSGAERGIPAFLEIRTATGRLERRLALPAGTAGAGARTLYWDGRNSLGRPSLSGMYLVRARTGDRSAVKAITWIP